MLCIKHNIIPKSTREIVLHIKIEQNGHKTMMKQVNIKYNIINALCGKEWKAIKTHLQLNHEYIIHLNILGIIVIPKLKGCHL